MPLSSFIYYILSPITISYLSAGMAFQELKRALALFPIKYEKDFKWLSKDWYFSNFWFVWIFYTQKVISYFGDSKIS